MSRDDSGLYTGINSASYARVKESKEIRQNTEIAKAAKLKKDARLVFELLDKQIASIPDQRRRLTKDDTAETWKTVCLGLDMYEQMCKGLRADLERTLSKTGGKR